MSCVGCVVGSEVHSWGAGGRVVMSCVGCVVGSAVVVEGEGDGAEGVGGGDEREEGASSSTGAMEVEEGVEGAQAAWWRAALLLSLALLLGPRLGRRRLAGWGGGGVGWRGALGRPRELKVLKVSLPSRVERERVASPRAAQQPRNSAKADLTRVSLVTFPALIFI